MTIQAKLNFPFLCFLLMQVCVTAPGFAENLDNVIDAKNEKFKAPEKATDCDGLFDSADSSSFLKNSTNKKHLEDQIYSLLMPHMTERYGKRHDMYVLEIGALRTTALAKALAVNTKLYLGVDCAAPSAAQQEFFASEGISNARGITGDVYDLPIADKSQDLVFASRSTPLGSVFATKASLTRAYSEIARVLKPDGEFVLYPEPREEIRSFDPSGSIFREIKRIRIQPNEDNPNPSYIIIFGKR